MATRNDISADYVRQLLDYERETGVLTWKARTPDMFEKLYHNPEKQCHSWNNKYAGMKAGCISHGRVLVSIYNKKYFAHRIAWLIAYGIWPEHEIDHVSGDSKDNCLLNLREATSGENHQNLSRARNNISGFSGVRYIKDRTKWIAFITVGKKRRHLGTFGTFEDAVSARLKAKKEMHPFQPVPREAIQ